MQTTISKSRFKTHALEIFRRVEQTGESVIVTDRGTPSLIVRKYVDDRSSPRDKLKGSVLRFDSPLAPVAEHDWEALA